MQEGRAAEGAASSSAGTEGTQGAAGTERLQALLGYARRLDWLVSAEAPTDPVDQELNALAGTSLLAVLAGMVMGGASQWRAERRAGPWPSIGELRGEPWSKAHEAVVAQQRQQVARILGATGRRGLLLGCMVAAGLGTQMVSSAYRGRADFVDFSLGGTAACTLLGLSRPGGSRQRNATLGALLGACVSVPAGLLQDRTWNWLPAEQQRKRVAWIARLEAGPPASSGTAQQQQAQQQAQAGGEQQAQAGGEQRAQQDRAGDTK